MLLAHAGGSWPTQSEPGRFPVRAKLSNRAARQCHCTHSNISVKLQKKKKNNNGNTLPQGLRGTGVRGGVGWGDSSLPLKHSCALGNIPPA